MTTRRKNEFAFMDEKKWLGYTTLLPIAMPIKFLGKQSVTEEFDR